MFKIGHTADNHLLDAQYGLTSRGEDYKNALLDIIQSCIRYDVDAIFDVGDLLNSTRPSPRIIRTLKHIHQILLDARLPMYVQAGNHDYTDIPWWSLVRDDSHDDRYGIIAVGEGKFELEKEGEKLTVFVSQAGSQEIIQGQAQFEPADVLMWHGSVREFCGFPSQHYPEIEQIPVDKYRICMLGDIHVHRWEKASNGTILAYPGSSELRDKGEAKDKKFFIWTFDGGTVTPESIDIKTRPVLHLQVNTEDQIQEVIQKINAIVDQGPIVFIRYDANLKDFLSRLYKTVKGTKCIIRSSPIASSWNKRSMVDLKPDGVEDIKIEDLLYHYVPRGTKLYDLGLRILNHEVSNNERKNMIMDYTSKFLETAYANNEN